MGSYFQPMRVCLVLVDLSQARFGEIRTPGYGWSDSSTPLTAAQFSSKFIASITSSRLRRFLESSKLCTKARSDGMGKLDTPRSTLSSWSIANRTSSAGTKRTNSLIPTSLKRGHLLVGWSASRQSGANGTYFRDLTLSRSVAFDSQRVGTHTHQSYTEKSNT